MAVPAIQMKNITISFQDKCIWDNFSLEVSQGERVVVEGRSGIGKSTLLKCLLGFMTPDKGEILVQGTPLTPESVWTLRTLMAYVPQEADLGTGTLREWVKAPFEFKANTGLVHNLDRLPKLFDRFLLSPDLLDTGVDRLSGGEKQRAAIISAILLDRKIILLDEPTSAMDSLAGKAVLDFFESMEEMAILAVSHDPAVLEMADKIINV